MSSKKESDRGRELKWMETILKVRSGQMDATKAATQLGVSRKTYYKWENRALEAMHEALQERPSGRPSRPEDGQKQDMEKQFKAIQKAMERMEQRAYIRDTFDEDIPALKEIMKRRQSDKKKGLN